MQLQLAMQDWLLLVFVPVKIQLTAVANTGVGQYALQNAVEGYNVGMGAYAGDKITTGQTNVCIGLWCRYICIR